MATIQRKRQSNTKRTILFIRQRFPTWENEQDWKNQGETTATNKDIDIVKQLSYSECVDLRLALLAGAQIYVKTLLWHQMSRQSWRSGQLQLHTRQTVVVAGERAEATLKAWRIDRAIR